jgi:hypothetical protein
MRRSGATCARRHCPVYYDPLLKRSKVMHEDLIRRMHEGGLITFTRRPRSRVGVFCVKKKHNRLRIVIDCRATNRRFRSTPHLPMGTGAAWADVCLGEGEEAWFSLSDIKDYFYACLIPAALTPYFCLLDVDDHFVKSLSDARFLEEDDSSGHAWCPALRVLPMGWNWSFYFAQIARSTEVQRSLELPVGCLLMDCRPPPRLSGDTLLALPDCDNLTVAATSEAAANRAREKVRDHCVGLGFVVHE